MRAPRVCVRRTLLLGVYGGDMRSLSAVVAEAVREVGACRTSGPERRRSPLGIADVRDRAGSIRRSVSGVFPSFRPRVFFLFVFVFFRLFFPSSFVASVASRGVSRRVCGGRLRLADARRGRRCR